MDINGKPLYYNSNQKKKTGQLKTREIREWAFLDIFFVLRTFPDLSLLDKHPLVKWQANLHHWILFNYPQRRYLLSRTFKLSLGKQHLAHLVNDHGMPL